MAEVYLAEQSEPVKRRVALKILKAGMDSKQVVARFESERQALAVLDHPNIAKIFDGGVAENGHPYFAMEHVRGVPITEYCDQQRLSNEARIQLFINVCGAVQHAHLKGLIHRDLKPSNILVGVVDNKPQPMIIDFGIAKATTTTLTETTLYTKVGQIVGTPQYMSPEQAGVTGLDVDTRSDIYSLGVILYELLVGAAPLDLVGIGDQAVQIALREKDPPLPSARFTQLDETRDEIAKVRGTDPEGLRRQLTGDLDWVVMKAIEKDRTRRYETANAVAMECRRYLRREPVMARPPSPGYLLRRFMQRNRRVVAAGSVAITAVIGGAGVATLGYVRATEAEQVARQEAETAKEVSGFLVDLFEVSDPGEARGNSITAREVLDRGAVRIHSELVGQPEIQAALMSTMGNVYTSLGLYQEAKSLLVEALEKTEETHGRDSLAAARVAYELAVVHRRLRDLDAAEPLFRQALEIREGKGDTYGNLVAQTLNSLAILQIRRGEFSEAENLWLRALSIYESDLHRDETELAKVLNNIGGLYSMLERGADAIPFLERSLAIRTKILEPGHPSLAESQHNLAVINLELGNYDAAETWESQALDTKRIILPADHPDLALSQHNYATILVRLKRYAEAEDLYLSVLDSQERVLGAEHPDRISTLESYADLLREVGREEEINSISLPDGRGDR